MNDKEFLKHLLTKLDGSSDLEDDHEDSYDHETENEEFRCVRCGEVCDKDDNSGGDICSYCSQVTR
jgi:hypothetical protein